MNVKIKSVKKVENISERYDLQIRNTNNFFANNILVHNSCFCIGYIPSLQHKELINGNIYASSKGINAKGLVFKHKQYRKPKWTRHIPFRKIQKFIEKKFEKETICNPENLYQNMLRKLIANGFDVWLKELAEKYNADKIHIFGEIFGQGIQDLGYGFKNPEFRVFDIAINNNFLPYQELKNLIDTQTTITMVPVLYVGPYDLNELSKHRDGNTTFNEKHIREGIVVRSTTEQSHLHYGRKIGKLISPDYLTRKNPDATEHN